MAKKQVSKKKANEGRPIKCRYCYESMEVQGHLLDGGFTATCPKCPHVIEHQGESYE